MEVTEAIHWGRFVPLCLSLGGCVFPQGVVSFLYRRLCLCGENFEGDRMNGNTYIFLCCLDREI